MYAVIFRAEILELDADYAATAQRMRELAIREYGCVDFVACTEGSTEIAISWWESKEQVQNWKRNVEHLAAQALGRSKWYKSYTVQVAEVVRAYSFTP